MDFVCSFGYSLWIGSLLFPPLFFFFVKKQNVLELSKTHEKDEESSLDLQKLIKEIED